MSTELNTINGVPVTSATKATTSTTPGGDLNKDAFLQLLVKQMQYQDPLSPQDNSAYVAQLAQFSSLEQMTNVASGMTNVSSLVSNIDSSLLVGQLNGMIGQNIQWMDDNKTTYSGKVLGVSISNGAPSIVAQASGTAKSVSVPVSQITLIGANATANTAASTQA